jgi:DNA-binding MarR family transcriptional regulator
MIWETPLRGQAMSAATGEDTKHGKSPSTCDAAHAILSPEKRSAWGGFLRAHSLVTKALDADLIASFGIQLSGFEVLSQLDGTDDGRMRMSDVAEGVLLSQSRISRLVSELEAKGLIERQSCSTDSRVVYAAITESGRERLREVANRHFEGVDARFFDGLEPREIELLAELWPRVIERALGAGKPG